MTQLSWTGTTHCNSPLSAARLEKPALPVRTGFPGAAEPSAKRGYETPTSKSRNPATFAIPAVAHLAQQWDTPRDGSAASQPASVPADPPSNLAGKRVVVVEDEGIIQLQLRRSLTWMGMKVVGVANNGAMGVEIVLAERPDMVLMDIRMPGEIDGLEAARRILSTFRTCIVMLTAYGLDEYRDRSLEIGVCGYVLKPVVGETLRPLLEQAYAEFSRSS